MFALVVGRLGSLAILVSITTFFICGRSVVVTEVERLEEGLLFF